MKTQIILTVKNESVLSRIMSWNGYSFYMMKAAVEMYVDSQDAQPILLESSKNPYVIDIVPGYHKIVFITDTKGKKSYDKVVGASMGAIFGLAMGTGITSAFAGADAGSDFMTGLMGHTQVQENFLECGLREGDILKVQIQPKRSGAVSVKLLQ